MQGKYTHWFILVLVSMLSCIFFNSLSTPKVSSQVLGDAPLISESNVISAFDPNLLRLLAKAYQPDAQGAVDRNQQGYISVAFQRYSSQRVIYGLQTQNLQLIEDAMRAFEYAFAYQQPDGSFPYLPPNGVSQPQAIDIASPVAGFYSDFGHCLILLQNSQWFQTSPDTADLRKRLRKLITPANASLTWLIAQQEVLSSYDSQTTNLLFLDASAYYLVGKALRRQDAIQLGKHFIHLALQQQMREGFFLEKGGYDSSYQGVSLRLALVLYTNLLSDATTLRKSLWSAIKRGVCWELTRVLTTGEVLTDGNTRVYPGGESYFDNQKGVDYTTLIVALNYYADVSGDSSVQNVANQVLSFKQQN